MTVDGSTVDYDGTLAGADALDLRWEAGPGRSVAVLAAHWTGGEGVRRTWRAEGVPGPGDRPAAEGDRGALALAMRSGGLVNVTAVRAEHPEDLPTEVPGAPGVRLGLSAAASAGLSWRVVAGGTPKPAARGPWARSWRGLRIRAARRLGRLLPARRMIVIDAGRPADPDVLAVVAALRSTDLDLVWIRREGAGDPPDGMEQVERGSVRHAWHQARACARIEGEGAEQAVGCRRGATVLALASTPVHRVGLDDPDVLTSRGRAAAVRRRGRTIGLLAVPTAGAGEVLAPALAVRGTVVPIGLPRMDPVLEPATRADLRATLDLPDDRPVVVHVPHPRPGSDLDLEGWADALGGDVYLVLAPGAESVPTRLRHAVRGLPADADVSAYLAVADLVVSDYSPRIGDAAVAGRPVVLYQPDRHEFLARGCGVYPGLEDVGPVILSQRDLHDEVHRWLRDRQGWDAPWRSSRALWAAEWAGPADGSAAVRAAEALMSSLRGAR